MLEYPIISTNKVRKLINASGVILNKCFDMLMSFCHVRKEMDVTIRYFQPILAECLYELMQFYQELHAEKEMLISHKAQYDPGVFAHIMKTNARHMQVVKNAMEVGKSLGDAYVWFFFRNNRHELDKHFEHEPTGLFVKGIGGQGELEFIKNGSEIEGLYTIYHGITTMLRIGDFSLFDATQGIVGTGELKTRLDKDALKVTAVITFKEGVIFPPQKPTHSASFEEKMIALKKDNPKIGKQLTIQSDMLRAKDSDNAAYIPTSYEYDVLNSLTLESPVAVNSDKSMLAVAVWSKYDSWYDILTSDEEIEQLPADFENKAKSMEIPGSSHNKLFLGHLKVHSNWLSIPMAWWDIDEKLCRDIYFRKVRIATAFNPARLLHCFAEDGFTIYDADNLEGYKIYRDIEGQRISVDNFEVMCYLVRNGFMKTRDVYTATKEIIDAIECGEYKLDKRINIHIRQNNFGKETKA